MAGEVKPQDADSGLVAREWRRTSRRRGQVTERTLEGEHIKAAWIDREGQMQRAAGTVIRNDAGELVVESWADGIRQEVTVTRDASIDIIAAGR
jgi:hypothetical protein